MPTAARRGRSDDRWSALEIPGPASPPAIAGVGDEDVSVWARDVLTASGAALLVPLVKAERLVGVLLLGDRGEPYGAEERLFAESLCVSAAAAIDNGRVYEELQRLQPAFVAEGLSARAALHALAGLGEISLEALAERLNEIVYSSTEGNRYVTAFFATVDAPTGETTFVNAGHCFPVLLRGNGTVERLEEGGPVIGLLPKISLTSGRTRLDSGDLLVLYTDGLSETSSPDGEEFEEERIIEIMSESVSKPSREIMATLLSHVRVFAAEAGLADDLTLMVVQRT